MDKASLIFCGGSLCICIAVAAIAFPYAALSRSEATAAAEIVDAESLGTMDLGDFGEVAVADMVTYYIENPPAPLAAGKVAKKVRFEGC